MDDKIMTLQAIAAIIGGVLGNIFGPIDGAMYALIIFVIIDFLTGLAGAFLESRVSSDVGYKGIARKLGIFVIVGVANVLDVYIIKEGGAIRLMSIFFYLANEGISILENAAIIGIPIPAKLKESLIQLREHAQDEGSPAE